MVGELYVIALRAAFRPFVLGRLRISATKTAIVLALNCRRKIKHHSYCCNAGPMKDIMQNILDRFFALLVY